jgi:hypothetical protein
MKNAGRRAKEREQNQKAEKEREADARGRRSTSGDLMWGDEGIDDPPKP